MSKATSEIDTKAKPSLPTPRTPEQRLDEKVQWASTASSADLRTEIRVLFQEIIRQEDRVELTREVMMDKYSIVLAELVNFQTRVDSGIA